MELEAKNKMQLTKTCVDLLRPSKSIFGLHIIKCVFYQEDVRGPSHCHSSGRQILLNDTFAVHVVLRTESAEACNFEGDGFIFRNFVLFFSSIFLPPLNFGEGTSNSMKIIGMDMSPTPTLLPPPVIRAFVKGSSSFLCEGFEMLETFAVDEPLIYIRTVFSQ